MPQRGGQVGFTVEALPEAPLKPSVQPPRLLWLL
jgi:hypothetical protein